jgi:hypothetical protein
VRLDDSDADTDSDIRGVALGVPLSASVVVLVGEPASEYDRVGEPPIENVSETEGLAVVEPQLETVSEIKGLADGERLAEHDVDTDGEGDVVRDCVGELRGDCETEPESE